MPLKALAEKSIKNMDTIGTTTPQDKLLALAQQGALYIDPEKDKIVDQPLETDDQQGMDLNHIIKSLIKAVDKEKSSPFQHLTTSQLDSALKNIVPSHRDLVEEKKGMIMPPQKFGNEPLSEKDIAELRLLKKDCKDANVEFALNIMNQFLEDKNFKFSETAILRHMHIIMPSHAVQYLSVITQRENVTLKEVYKEMVIKYGASKSNADLTNAIYTTVGKSTNALQMVHEIADLIDLAREDRAALTVLAVQETENFIRRHYDPAISSTIKLWYCLKGSCSYRTYTSIIDEQFAHVLSKNIKTQTQVHNNETTVNTEVGNVLSDTLKLVSTLNNKVDDLLMNQNVHNVQLGMNQQTNKPLICHLCRKQGHFKKDCPSNSNKGFTNMSRKATETKNSYCNQQCSIHKKSTHSNKECKAQGAPCTHAPNHKFHKASDCFRDITRDGRYQGGQVANMPPQNNQDLNPIMSKLMEAIEKLK